MRPTDSSLEQKRRPHGREVITITVVTTAEDLVDDFHLRQPTRVVFKRALALIDAEANRDFYTLEFQNQPLDLDVRLGEHAARFDWGDAVELELVPRPEVI